MVATVAAVLSADFNSVQPCHHLVRRMELACDVITGNSTGLPVAPFSGFEGATERSLPKINLPGQVVTPPGRQHRR